MPAFSPSAVATALASAAATNMATLAAAVTTWQTLITGGNQTLAALLDGLRTGNSLVTVSVFTNGWSSSSNTVRYYKDITGRVHLMGQLTGTTINTAAFALPAGFLPTKDCVFAVASNGVYGQLNINAGTGVVTPQVGSATLIGLDGVSFYAG